MNKNIVLCSDGTGNTPGKGRGTNVWKLYLAVDRHGHEEDPDLEPQIAFYDDGVGTGGIRIAKLAGGAFGWGLSRNMLRLYASLVLHYQPGDKVFLFGFSRGAFTVRSLAGMICHCGLLKREDYLAMSIREREKTLKRILTAYRNDDKDAGPNIRKELNLERVEIDFIGVWDTVDAVGLPFDGLKYLDKIWRKLRGVRLWGFYDQKLNSRVKRACQALAIDDARETFHPNVWERRAGIDQVWFAGVHSNVGGGYPKEGLANITLYWMLVQARGIAKLRFVPDAVQAAHDQANAYAKLYDSRAGPAVFYRYNPRKVADLYPDGAGPINVHVTALDRTEWTTDGYAPSNLPAQFDVVDPDASRKAGVATRVRKQQTRVKSTAPNRGRDARENVDQLVRGRIRQYYLFLLLNGAFLAMLIALSRNLPGIAGWLENASASLRPFLGWTRLPVTFIVDNASALLSGTIGLLIPGFLVGPIQSLTIVPELVTLFVLFGGLLFWRRQVVVRQLREQGERMWPEPEGVEGEKALSESNIP